VKVGIKKLRYARKCGDLRDDAGLLVCRQKRVHKRVLKKSIAMVSIDDEWWALKTILGLLGLI